MPNRRKITDEEIVVVLKELAEGDLCPSKQELVDKGYGTVANSINSYGGYGKYAALAGLKTRDQKHRPRNSLSVEECMVTLLEVSQDGYMPTPKEMRAAGKIHYYTFMYNNGGSERFAQLTGLKLRQTYWNQEKVISNLISMLNKGVAISGKTITEEYGRGMLNYMYRHHKIGEWKALADITRTK